MLLIGIDPSFSGTGITAEWDNEIIFQGEMSSKANKTKTNYVTKLLIDKNNCYIGDIVLPNPISPIDDGDMQRIIDYSHNLSKILCHLIEYGAQLNSDIAVHIAIEIPMGSHMGAGAKVDRCYAAGLMAMDNFIRYVVNPFAKINILAIYPKKVKKIITGNGNAKKDTVQEHLVAKYNYKSNYMKNFNISDSFAIMEYLKNDLKHP